MLPSSYESGPGEAVGGCGARQLFGHSTVVTSSAWPLQNDSVAWNLIVRAQNGGVYANSKCGAVLLVMVYGPRGAGDARRKRVRHPQFDVAGRSVEQLIDVDIAFLDRDRQRRLSLVAEKRIVDLAACKRPPGDDVVSRRLAAG